MGDFAEQPEDNPGSLEGMLCDEPEEQHEMGRLEAKLEGMRKGLVERFPFLEKAIGGNYDIKIGITQGIGTIIPTVAVNLAFFLTPAAALPYVGLMVGRYFLTWATMAGAYIGVHYLMNDEYKGRLKELFSEAVKFTGLERGTFIPARILSLGVETLLVGTLGWSRYIVGNFVSPLFTTLQTFGSNYAGKNLAEGYSMGAALKQGFKSLGSLLWDVIRSPYTLCRKAYDAAFNKEQPLPYPIDSPEEYIADWHASNFS